MRLGFYSGVSHIVAYLGAYKLSYFRAPNFWHLSLACYVRFPLAKDSVKASISNRKSLVSARFLGWRISLLYLLRYWIPIFSSANHMGHKFLCLIRDCSQPFQGDFLSFFRSFAVETCGVSGENFFLGGSFLGPRRCFLYLSS